MNLLRRLRSRIRPFPWLGRGLKGAITLMASTDTGWARRYRVPRAALAAAAILLLALTLTTAVSVTFAVWAGADLRRLSAVEQENRSLTAQLQDQATLLNRLQSEMARLRELEKNLRAVSGLGDRAGTNEATGQGGGLSAAGPRR